MLQALFGFVASVLLLALVNAAQVPLVSSQCSEDPDAAIPCDSFDLTEWNLDKFPNPNATDHLVFETVYSLLQQWPNTRMRNGHTIVPGVIPKGTLLYHGRHDNELPLGLEWVSVDPEHSHVFCGYPMFGSKSCWLLTFATTRPLKVIYFDGTSAAKLPYGSMDSQDLLAWGDSPISKIWEEGRRAEDLCRLRKEYGVDGFVRMEVDFEIILCDFTSGVRVVSSANILYSTVMSMSAMSPGYFESIHAGSWNNRLPGETRIRLDLAGLVSFYDTKLVPSLVAVRAGQERWDHRILDISGEDLLAVKSRLKASLIRPPGVASGIDWKIPLRAIVDRFAGRLELVHHLLNTSATNSDEIIDVVNKTQTQLRVMLTPYILVSATPTDTSDKGDLEWTRPIFKLCATTHTYPMESELDSMTDSEKLIFRGVRGTSREICRVVTRMWAAGVYAGIDWSLNRKDSLDVAELTLVQSRWVEDLNRLMAWLDWSVWVKCKPECSPEEICYLPTWPVEFPRLSNGPSLKSVRSWSDSEAEERLDDKGIHVIMPDSDEWYRPQPKCIKRFGFY